MSDTSPCDFIHRRGAESALSAEFITGKALSASRRLR